MSTSATSEAFDRGAAHYDLMVALNPGYHAELRRAASALAGRLARVPSPAGRAASEERPLTLLDLACGSGASTRALVDAAGPDAQILGLDASRGMLGQARAKDWPAGVRFDQAVAGRLDLDALGRGTFDGALTAYLFRNVPEAQRDGAAVELFELLRPGGWLAVQEYSVAGSPRARQVWDAVALGVIVPLGWVVDRNPDLYRYLWRSVVEFDTVDRFAARLHAAGFVDVASTTASGWQRGILHTFVARKPEE